MRYGSVAAMVRWLDRAVSDGGSGAELVLCGGDRLATLTREQRRAVDRMRKRVKRNAPECAEVLSLILRFGRDRGKSIATMSAQDGSRGQGGEPSSANEDMKHRLKAASNRYFRHRKTLMALCGLSAWARWYDSHGSKASDIARARWQHYGS